MTRPADFDDFCRLSAALGRDPLRVQGAGGNTSLKENGVMWIKASGTELALAREKDIFVAVDRDAARAEVDGGGDGSCASAVIDPSAGLRPSIETTFHAVFDWRVVAHTHSVATLCHVVSPDGSGLLDEKLSGLPWVSVPFAKPGLPLTRKIMARAETDTQVVLLENHGLICLGKSVVEVERLINEVEDRLALPARPYRFAEVEAPPEGFTWAEASWIAQDGVAFNRAISGSYYPDHVVFLGPALTQADRDGTSPAILMKGKGVALRQGATPAQQARLRCLSDVLSRVPESWSMRPIGPEAEADLLDWDAEKYRQALAERS